MTAYQKAKEKKQKEAPRLIEFAKLTFKKDMILAFKGTHGSSYRKIVEVRDRTVVGLVIHYWAKRGWVLEGGASENSIENLKGYFADDGQFIKRKQILETYEQGGTE